VLITIAQIRKALSIAQRFPRANDEYQRKTMQMTLLNRTDDGLGELALIRSAPISMRWTNELQKSVGLYPSCKLLRELLSLDFYTRTVIYPLLIKGWSSRRIADRLKVSLVTIQKLLESGREQLQRKLRAPRENWDPQTASFQA
jgi:hypothetical protein